MGGGGVFFVLSFTSKPGNSSGEPNKLERGLWLHSRNSNLFHLSFNYGEPGQTIRILVAKSRIERKIDILIFKYLCCNMQEFSILNN